MNMDINELKERYFQDWRETDAPWERWEFRRGCGYAWKTLATHPDWEADLMYRRKGEKITINGIELGVPCTVAPPHGSIYYTPVLCSTIAAREEWAGDQIDEELLANGFVFLTEKDAASASTLISTLYVKMLKEQKMDNLKQQLTEAWHLLSILSSNMLDDGPTWPRVLEWLERNEEFRPDNTRSTFMQTYNEENDSMKPETTDTPLKADCSSASCSASWMPIKTAPNSLNVILVTDGEAVWTDQKISDNPDDVDGDYYFNGHENWKEVTHWMPIPSLPNDQVKARRQ